LSVVSRLKPLLQKQRVGDGTDGNAGAPRYAAALH